LGEDKRRDLLQEKMEGEEKLGMGRWRWSDGVGKKVGKVAVERVEGPVPGMA